METACVLLMLLFFLICMVRNEKRKNDPHDFNPKKVHGDAEFATDKDLKRGGLL